MLCRDGHAARACAPRAGRGLTLVEMIVVIAITGIVAAAVAAFIRRPVEGYADSARRAELTDLADTALRRITRDLRTALPNSIRVTAVGPIQYLEYLQTSGGGRYRGDPDSGGAGDVLDFAAEDASFDVIGPMPTLAAGDSVVVYNLAADPAIATGNAYVGDNRALVDAGASTASNVALDAPKRFPLPSPGRRFHVVQYPVTYACAPDPANPGLGELRRYWGYAIQPAQPTPPSSPPAGGSNALLAGNVAACSFTYVAGATQRAGVVALSLELRQGSETVRLLQQVQVSNVP